MIVEQGVVYLVGAGPGDPGCLTVRGRECLERADVVVYDYLANPALLVHCKPGAERVFAGKHGTGERLLEQAEINRLLVERARAGQVVVRLKGGDPFVFGRGGEEGEALVEAGLRFEVVPGVTSALAAPAYAGIPVTHRDWVSGVTVLTGHEAPGWEGRVRWEHVATAGNTIVLLMGLTQLRGNLARLLEAGLPPDTPAAAIRWASSPAQQVVCATARELTEVVERHGFRPPVTVVIGQVVLLRERLHWFERRPLFGRRVLVTRARAQASALTGLLVEQGAEVIECPAIEIEPLESRELDVALANLARYDWLIFTSRNGVERFFSRLRALDWDVRALHAARLAAIGPETARALEERLLKVDVMAEDFRAEGLLEAMARQRLRGSRILLPRAEGAREVLTDELRANGAQVDEIATYRSVVPGASVAILRAALTKRLDCLSFTSSSTVKHFFHLLELACGQDGRERICQARIACIGPITAATAVRAGLAVHIVPDQYTVPALARAIAEDFSKRRES